jgi:pSer/pThr/pTyr-binding forkhead associated (FHA) protein
MPAVTFQVLEGIDKGRVYRDLLTPVTIGREEGNIVRLNDERVSRFHAKVQVDNNEIILTDLDSTNGTRVNNNVVQIRRLRPGDRVGIGRSLLLFGSEQEIAARAAVLSGASTPAGGGDPSLTEGMPPTIYGSMLADAVDNDDARFELNPQEEITTSNGTVYMGNRPLPPLPQKLSPSQAARLAELFDFLHRHLGSATENTKVSDDGLDIRIGYAEWQRILAVQLVLARYVRAVAEPDSLED